MCGLKAVSYQTSVAISSSLLEAHGFSTGTTHQNLQLESSVFDKKYDKVTQKKTMFLH